MIATVIAACLASERSSASVGAILGQRRRRWPRIAPKLDRFPVPGGKYSGFNWQLPAGTCTKYPQSHVCHIIYL